MLDTHLRLPVGSRLATGARDLPTLVIAGPEARKGAADRLETSGVEVERVGVDPDGHVDLGEALRALSTTGRNPRLQRGRPERRRPADRMGLADEVVLITAEKPLGRPGLPALSEATRGRLFNSAGYRLFERAAYGSDVMRRWERFFP